MTRIYAILDNGTIKKSAYDAWTPFVHMQLWGITHTAQLVYTDKPDGPKGSTLHWLRGNGGEQWEPALAYLSGYQSGVALGEFCRMSGDSGPDLLTPDIPEGITSEADRAEYTSGYRYGFENGIHDDNNR